MVASGCVLVRDNVYKNTAHKLSSSTSMAFTDFFCSKHQIQSNIVQNTNTGETS